MIFQCPHCKGKATIRTSRSVNLLLRELNYQCHDVECGHTFSAFLEVHETISPSAKPDPSVHLPMSEYTRRKLLQSSSLTSEWRHGSVLAPTQPVQPEQDRKQKRTAPTTPPAQDTLSKAFFGNQGLQAQQPAP